MRIHLDSANSRTLSQCGLAFKLKKYLNNNLNLLLRKKLIMNFMSTAYTFKLITLTLCLCIMIEQYNLHLWISIGKQYMFMGWVCQNTTAKTTFKTPTTWIYFTAQKPYITSTTQTLSPTKQNLSKHFYKTARGS